MLHCMVARTGRHRHAGGEEGSAACSAAHLHGEDGTCGGVDCGIGHQDIQPAVCVEGKLDQLLRQEWWACEPCLGVARGANRPTAGQERGCLVPACPSHSLCILCSWQVTPAVGQPSIPWATAPAAVPCRPRGMLCPPPPDPQPSAAAPSPPHSAACVTTPPPGLPAAMGQSMVGTWQPAHGASAATCCLRTSDARRRTMPSPMPAVEAVTTATLPSSLLHAHRQAGHQHEAWSLWEVGG